MAQKIFYSWGEFILDMYGRIIPQLIPSAHNFTGVWGPPRGGLILAVILSHQLELPFLEKPLDRRTLIVDDIADTGKTLAPFREHTIVTLFYHRQSVVTPTIWVREKTDGYIIFPWEKK